MQFDQNFLKRYETLCKANIGFEIEFYSDKSYYKILEKLNNTLNPIKVWGFQEYHSNFKPDSENFKIEPDFSGGNNMIELITGVLNYVDAKLIFYRIMGFIKEIAYTGKRSAVHINISFDEEDDDPLQMQKLNILKFILNLDEEKIFKEFPNRRNNIYAKSIKNIIPFKGYDFSGVAVNVLKNSVFLPDHKYYGVNFSKLHENRLEIRYLGGEDYEKKDQEIISLMDYFILLTWNCISADLEEKDNYLLHQYLDYNINLYKTLTKFSEFIEEYPHINIQVDKNSEYQIVNSYFHIFADKLYDLVTGCENISESIINWDSDKSRLELVETKFKSINNIEDIDIINCEIEEGFFYDCNFYGCDIKNSHFIDSKISDCYVYKSKMENCHVDERCELNSCYFTFGFMDGEMKKCIFRNGKIGENAIVSSDTQIIAKNTDYFGRFSGGNNQDKKKMKKKDK